MPGHPRLSCFTAVKNVDARDKPGHDELRDRRQPSKHLEIFAMLPVGNLRLKPLDLGVLDVNVIVDELGAERAAEKRIVVEREHRFAQTFRQQCRLGAGYGGRISS